MTRANREQEFERLGRVVTRAEVAMLTTQDNDGSLHSRPMMTCRFDPEGVLWFFTYESAHKVVEVEHRHSVNVSYSAPTEQLYASVSGPAEVVTDHRRMDELWNDTLRPWFPQGLSEPDLALLKVTVEHAEVWDGLAAMAATSVSIH